MKLRKLFAWLMTVIMLIGMMPAAQASRCPESASGEHDWITEVIRNPGCDTNGLEAIVCSICGEWAHNGTIMPPLGHNWGSWSWAHGTPACTESAWQVRECKRCGQMADRWVAGSDHKWGDAKTVTRATCEEPGVKVMQCTVCGAQKRSEIKARGHDYTNFELLREPTCQEYGRKRGYCSRCDATIVYNVKTIPHIWTEWEIVREATDKKDGLRERHCTMCGLTEEESFGVGEQDDPSNSVVSALTVTVVSELPASMQVDEEVRIMLRVENTGDTILKMGSTQMSSFVDALHHDSAEGDDPNWLEPGQSYVVPYTLKALAADAESGAAERSVTFNASVWANEKVGYLTPANKDEEADVSYPVVIGLSGSVTFSVPVAGEEAEKDIPELICSIYVYDSPANGKHFEPGEEISFSVFYDCSSDENLINALVYAQVQDTAVHNTGNTLYLQKYIDGDSLTGHVEGSFDFEYVVTAEDAARGAVYAEAAFWADMEDGTPCWEGISKMLTVPCGPASLTVTKAVFGTPGSPSGEYEPGDTISYMISVENTSGEDLYDLVISDPLKGGNEDAVIDMFPTFPAGEGVTVQFNYTVTMDDAAPTVTGVTNTAYAMAVKADGTPVEAVSNTVTTEVFFIGEMGISKAVTNTPANGMHFVPGETVEFAITLSNETYYPFYSMKLYDSLCEDQYVYPFGENDVACLYGEDQFDDGVTETITCHYVVTEEDALAGSVENVAMVSFTTFNGVTYQRSATVTVPCGLEITNPVTAVKSIANQPANGEFYTPGEVVSFTITATNCINAEIAGVVITDPLAPEWIYESGVIAPGESVTAALPYTVTEMDCMIGSVTNYASVRAYVPDGYLNLTTGAVTALCGYADGSVPFGIHSSLEIIKAVESLPANGSYYQAGETVSYRITYVNGGESVLTNVMIYDALAGVDEIASAEMLHPGESRSCYFSHTVTEEDVACGFIINTATAQYTAHDFAHTAVSNTVLVDTDGAVDHLVAATPWTPESGFITILLPEDSAAEPGSSSPFGTIDADQLRTGDSCCSRTIISRDNVSVTYEISYCDAHLTAQSSVLMMKQASATPEMQMQSAAYSVALWRSEVEKLYQEILAAADPAARAAVMTEYVRFLTYAANYETIMRVTYPDQPVLAAQKVAAMWEDKCVALCCEIHTDASARTDSLLLAPPAAGASADSCSCLVAAEENGRKTVTYSYCPTHSFPFSMTDALLNNSDTAEAWTMVRQIWSVELNRVYNLLAARLGDNSPLAMAACNALTQWMMARESSLIALYPDNPELVVQTMVKLIMEHCGDMCQQLP